MFTTKGILRIIYQALIGVTLILFLTHINKSHAIELDKAKMFAKSFKSFQYYKDEVFTESVRVYNLDETQDQVLGSNNDKYSLINIWATWCIPCVKELPSLKLLSESPENKNIQVKAVSLDFDRTPERLIKFLGKVNVDTQLARYDKDNTFRRWVEQTGIIEGGLPVTLILSPKGKIIFSMLGEADWNSPESKEFLKTIAKNTAYKK